MTGGSPSSVSLVLQAELANCHDEASKDIDSRVDGVCDDCLAVPWENFGTSDDPTSFTKREPFAAWKYIAPAARTWPSTSTFRVRIFLQDLLVAYGYESTTSIRKLRGGWDGQKPFRMTFLELGQEEEESMDSDSSEDERDTSVPASKNDIFDFQLAMRGYKPTDADLGVIKSWLSERNTVHVKKCRPQNRNHVRNLKVIDCAKRAVVSAPPDCSLVALLYVWGPPSARPDLTSTELNMVLPPTIEDSITVTQELGSTYLWIDRYYINQDDEQEKQQQIEQMADIYASAAVTIIAAAGEGRSHGLPGIRKTTCGLTRVEQVRSIRLL